MRVFFNEEREESPLYHIVLNTERLPVDACVKAICLLARHPRFQDRATIRSALANRLLETKISSALSENIGIGMAPAGLTVSAANGRIILAGVTSSGSLRRRAEQLACTIEGVRNIDNRIVSVPTRGCGS
jgi:hypothetical protein